MDKSRREIEWRKGEREKQEKEAWIRVERKTCMVKAGEEYSGENDETRMEDSNRQRIVRKETQEGMEQTDRWRVKREAWA